MSKYVKKLGSDKTYKRPKTTYQENLTADEIAEKMQGYEKVDNIAEVPLNTHIRYFITQKDGTQLFRTGGFLHNKTNADKFIMLSNGKSIWSVQINNAIFFKKMSHQEELDAIHALYKKKLDDKDLTISKLKKYIKTKLAIGVADNTNKFGYENIPNNYIVPYKQPSAQNIKPSNSKRTTSSTKKNISDNRRKTRTSSTTKKSSGSKTSKRRALN